MTKGICAAVAALFWMLAPSVQAASQSWWCTNCGKENSADGTFCFACGVQRRVQTSSTPSYSSSSQSSVYRSSKRDHWTPLKFTIGGQAGIPGGDFNNVCGWEAGILWNDSNIVGGLQTSIFYNKANELYGIQTALVNNSDEGGFLQAGIVNVSKKFFGFQIGCIANNAEDDTSGIRVGLFNIADRGSAVHGIDIGYYCGGDGDMSGIQIGVVNIQNGNMHGIQIGYINFAKRMTGLQLGVLNMIGNSSVPFFPVINAHF